MALGVACLFAVNPVIIDDFLAATGGESMANFFLFAVLLLYLKDKWVPALLLAVPALFAKESNVMLPALLLLCYAYQGRLKKDWVKALWLLPLCAGFLLMRHLFVVSPREVTAPELLRFIFTVFPRVVFHYLAVLLAPLQLETWPRAFAAVPYWGLTLAGALASAAALFLLPVQRRTTAFCLGWFLLVMAPRVPAVLATRMMMDKWVFLASPAVFILLLILLLRLRENRRAWLRAVPPAAVAALCLFWAAIAHSEVRLRGSDEKNYLWAIRKTPHTFVSYRLGVIYLQTGRVAEAAQVLLPLVRDYAWNPDYHNAYAMALWHSGRSREAWAQMQDLARRCPDNKAIQDNAAGMRARMAPAQKKR